MYRQRLGRIYFAGTILIIVTFCISYQINRTSTNIIKKEVERVRAENKLLRIESQLILKELRIMNQQLDEYKHLVRRRF